MPNMRINIYIDGFNLYFRALHKRPQYRWLDLNALCGQLIDPNDQIGTINYYTAHINQGIDFDGHFRQLTYLDAISTIQNCNITYGNFLTKDTWSRLRYPIKFKPDQITSPNFNPDPDIVSTVRAEEKGSDVNLAAHLVRDAYKNTYDVAAVITNDTDLCEAIRIVRDEASKPVILLSPTKRAAPALQAVVSTVRYIRAGHLAKSQFPDEVTLPDGRSIQKPATWTDTNSTS